MTTVTFHRRTKQTRRVKPKTGRTGVNAVDVIAASVIVIRPVCVSVALIAAFVLWPGRAHAGRALVSAIKRHSFSWYPLLISFQRCLCPAENRL